MSAFRVAREDNQPLSPIGCSPEIATLTTLRSRSRRAPTRVLKHCAEQGSGALKGWNYRGLGAVRAQKKAATSPILACQPRASLERQDQHDFERVDHVRGAQARRSRVLGPRN